MEDIKNIDLRGKTIYDITDEKTAQKYAILPKQKHEKCLITNPHAVIMTFLRYAEATNNKELEKQIETQFKKEISTWINE